MKRLIAPLLWLLLLIPIPLEANDTIRLGEAAQKRVGIQTEQVGVHSFAERFRIVGEVVRTPGTTITIETSVKGRVEEVRVAPGAAVKAHQPLLVLRSHDIYCLANDLLKLNVKRNYMEDRYRAGRELYALEGISHLELEMRRREFFNAKLEFEQARNRLLELGYTPQEVDRILRGKGAKDLLEVRSPAEGVVLQTPVQQHDWVKAFHPLVVIGDPDQLELRFEIPPAESLRIGTGDRVEFMPAGKTDRIGTALVLTPIPEVDPETRTVAVRAEILSFPGPLLPGVFIEGTVAGANERSAPSVPEGAVIRIGDRDHVFVRKGPKAFEPRPVRLGRFDGERYEVLEGVKVGEEIVTRGVFFLKSALIKGKGEDD